MYRCNEGLSSDQIPLSPTVAEQAETAYDRGAFEDHDDTSSQHGYVPAKPDSVYQQPLRQPTLSKDRHYMFIILTVMSMVFLVLNVVQIALIFTISNIYWLVVFPSALFAAFLLYFAFETWRRREGLSQSWRQAHWQTRIARIGIVATVFLNIIACEFGYLNGEAKDVASEKIWRTSFSSHISLPPPAMALAQDTIFLGRGVLANDTSLLNELSRNASGASIGNQRAFKDFHQRPLPAAPDGTPTELNYVIFDGDYQNLTQHDDVDLLYNYYYNLENPQPALGFLVFDPKFLASRELLHKAMDCGIISGNLFDPVGRSQLSLEAIDIFDRIGAFSYTNDTCNNEPEFRSYLTYRFALSKYASVPLGDCGVENVWPPDDQRAERPCQGDIDIRYSTMLVAKQMSAYRKNWIEMLTDEGGIIGGIMFITWFMSILSQ